jgi:chemotaxis family two-component system response regulator PixG
MTTQQNLPILSFGNFTASKKARFFETLKQLQFNGQLVLKEPKKQQWIFYLHLGCIIYATGGVHPVRRWSRNLAAYCPELPSVISALQREVSGIKGLSNTTCWEYQLLSFWVAQKKISREQATKIVHSTLMEVLFDVAQAKDVTYQIINSDNSLSIPLILVDSEQMIVKVQLLWQGWQNAKATNYSPNSAPITKRPEELREHTSSQIYQTLTNLLDGKRTLRDLALQMRRDVVQVTRSLLPYIQLGLLDLISIPDLRSPVDVPVPPKTPSASAASNKPLVACVDDDLWVCQTMEKLLTAAGYQFVGVNDGLRAFAILISRKPDLVFLDLVMPNTNGYEICIQLRKLSFFQNTPIVILSGNDGVVDQVRARLVGATDFLSKPIDAGTVLNVLHKHLQKGASRIEGC